jgi:phosphomevalonate kinase
MRARAPGKVVLSGAYAVLEGAPAIVSAVNRYALADSSCRAGFVTPELELAVGKGKAPMFDASALREGQRKLGLGSSAAVLVACLAALALDQDPRLGDQELAERVWPAAVNAHRTAQGGGSGIDVVTCALGSTRVCWLDGAGLHTRPHSMPADAHVEIHAAQLSASTPEMLAHVRQFARSNPSGYLQLIGRLSEAARSAVGAQRVAELVDALRVQLLTLASLGDATGVAIVPEGLREIAACAFADGVAILPSGAGGGDIVLCVGEKQACEGWRSRLSKAGLTRLEISIGARGVHRVPAVG